MSVLFAVFLWVPITLSDPVEITIFHTNDIHAQFLPTEATWLEDKPKIGGFAALSHYVKSERDGLQRSLLLDAGDLMTGSVICEIEHQGALGGALIDMMNKIGYDGMVVGNHEFDIGASNARKLMEIAEFPILCSNMFKDDVRFNEPGYHIYTFDDLKVGVIGVIYHPMAGKAPDSKLDGFNSVEPIGVINDLVQNIDPQTDLIIVLSHLGIGEDKKIAPNLTGVDLIIGGHSHATLDTPLVINDVIIAQAGTKTRYLGRIDIKVEDDQVLSFEGKLIPTFVKNINPNPEISDIIEHYDHIINEKYGEIICELKSEWNRRGEIETNVGNFITDAVRKATRTDFAIINSGSIRKNIGPGPISRRDILEMMPFDNEVVKFNCTGEKLRAIAYEIIGPGEALQFSGIDIKWKNTDTGREVVELLVNGEPVIDDKIYKVTSSDYVVVYNSERYLGYTIEEYEKTGYKMIDMIVDAAARQKIIDSKIEGRVQRIE
jgi:2',3'-cyclic-nucleotide 2'-phosphodiesterase (5'-nucleotidase family)